MNPSHAALLGLIPQAGQPRVELAVQTTLVIDSDFTVALRRGAVTTEVLVTHEVWRRAADHALLINRWASVLPEASEPTYVSVRFSTERGRASTWRCEVAPGANLVHAVEYAAQRAFQAWELVRS